MLKIEFTGQFKKDYKLALKRGCDPRELESVISILANEQKLPEPGDSETPAPEKPDPSVGAESETDRH